MATVEEVESTLADLIRLLEKLDPGSRAMLPSRRLIEARCADLGLVYHAAWRNGQLGEMHEGPPSKRADIRIEIDSDDLLAVASGERTFKSAFQSQRIRIDASMTDLLRLRAALA